MKKASIALSILFVASPIFAIAHTEGASLEEQVGNHIIDIGYAPEEVRAGEPVRFDFSFSGADTIGPASFTDIWVRVERDRKLFFAGNIGKSPFGPTGMTFTFPEAGTYTLYTRYEEEGETLAEASFLFEVVPGATEETGFSPVFLLAGFIGALIAIMVAVAVIRKK